MSVAVIPDGRDIACLDCSAKKHFIGSICGHCSGRIAFIIIYCYRSGNIQASVTLDAYGIAIELWRHSDVCTDDIIESDTALSYVWADDSAKWHRH